MVLATFLLIFAWFSSLTDASRLTHAAAPRNIKWKSSQGNIYANEQVFKIKGTSWFGFEETTNVLHGLWGDLSIDDGLMFLTENGFNSLRIPLAIDTINANPRVDEQLLNKEPELVGKTSLDILDVVIEKCANHNILVMLDNHRLRPSAGIGELWYDNHTSVEQVKQAWSTLAERYCDTWNVFAADIKNEPHGIAEWGTKDPMKDWKMGAEDLGNHVLSKCSKWLIFVEGVERNIEGDKSRNGWWGGKLQGIIQNPIQLNDQSKLVYSPHVYGPSVHMQEYFANMAEIEKIWDDDFGFVPEQSGKPIVIGEWGGRYTALDKDWQDKIVLYMARRGIGHFYWCLNPNSHDTGGLLQDDWKTPQQGKLDMLKTTHGTSVSSL